MEKTLANVDDRKLIAFFLNVQGPVVMRTAPMCVGAFPSETPGEKSLEHFKHLCRGWFGKSKAIRMLKTYSDAITMQTILLVLHQRLTTLSQKDAFFVEDVLDTMEAAFDALKTVQDLGYITNATWNLSRLFQMLTSERQVPELDGTRNRTEAEIDAFEKKLAADRIARRAARLARGDTGFGHPPMETHDNAASSEASFSAVPA